MEIVGRTPALSKKRVLSILGHSTKLGMVLVSVHKPDDPVRGWSVWVKPEDLAQLAAKAVELLRGGESST